MEGTQFTDGINVVLCGEGEGQGMQAKAKDTYQEPLADKTDR